MFSTNRLEGQEYVNISDTVRYLRRATHKPLLVEDDGYYATYTVPTASSTVDILMDFSYQPLGGVRYWLVCRYCERRVANLYLRNSTLACRHCFKLEYTSRLYRRSTIYAQYWRMEKAAHIMQTRRLIYAGEPTRAQRRVRRLIGNEGIVGLTLEAFARNS